MIKLEKLIKEIEKITLNDTKRFYADHGGKYPLREYPSGAFILHQIVGSFLPNREVAESCSPEGLYKAIRDSLLPQMKSLEKVLQQCDALSLMLWLENLDPLGGKA